MKKKIWFTLIEILIAITVFSIGVLAVLRVLTWNLSIMDNTEMKLQSTVLAKEWLELLYNLRDSNLEKELPWNCVLNMEVYNWNLDDLEDNTEDKICTGYYGSDNFDKILQLSFDWESYYYQNLTWSHDYFTGLFEDNQLCLFTWIINGINMSWFSYCSWDAGESTFFARYLSFTWVVTDSMLLLPKDKILKVESHVLYKKWHKTWDIVFESFIWNY